MNFTNIDYFLMTAQERSFSHAAEKLHVTQQTLSGQIAAMERELGCRLFVRHVPLELTDAGQAFLNYALSFRRNYHAMRQELHDVTQQEKGTLRIGVAFTRGHVILPPFIRSFQERHPQITIALQEQANEDLLCSLKNDTVDLILADIPEQLPGIQTEEWYQEEVYLLLPDALLRVEYGTRAQEVLQALEQREDLHVLADCPFLMSYPQDIAGKIAENLLQRADFQPIVRVKSHNMETLLSCCIEGMGACFCPDSLIRSGLTAQQLRDVHRIRFHSGTTYTIRFGWRENGHLWRMIREFIDHAHNNKGCLN